MAGPAPTREMHLCKLAVAAPLYRDRAEDIYRALLDRAFVAHDERYGTIANKFNMLLDYRWLPAEALPQAVMVLFGDEYCRRLLDHASDGAWIDTLDLFFDDAPMSEDGAAGAATD
eukprot:1330705-Prymnesium_polylepis.1